MLQKQETLVVKNDRRFTIRVKIDRDEYLVPPRAWLQAGSEDHIYLSMPGDAPMRAFPLAVGIEGRQRRSATRSKGKRVPYPV